MRSKQGCGYFITHIVPDGPEKYLGIPGPLSVALSINQNQTNSLLLTCSTEKSELESDPRISKNDVSIVKKYQWGTRLSSGFSPNLWFKILTTGKNHIFHFHFSRSINSVVIALILISQKRAFLTQTHGSVMYNDRVLTRWYDKLITKRLLRESRQVVALQENEKNQLIGLALSPIPVLVIQNSVQFKGTTQVRTPRKEILVGFVGHLRPGNNPWIFLETAKLLQNQGDFEFIMIGADGGLAQQLKQDIEFSKMENISIVGHQDLFGLQKYYEAIDVLVCPAETAQAVSFMDGIASGALGVTSRDNASWEFYNELGAKIVENSPRAYADYLLSNQMRENLYSSERVINCEAKLTALNPKSLAIVWEKVYEDIYQMLFSNRAS
jgi:glycosyltransferase involved in cell wall biosynthesis